MDLAINDVMEEVRNDLPFSQLDEFENEQTAAISLPHDETLYTHMTKEEQHWQMKQHLAKFTAAYAEDHPLALAKYKRQNQGIYQRHLFVA